MKENCKKWSLYVVIALLVVIGLPLATTLIQPNNTSCDYHEIAARGVLHVGLLRTPLSYHVENDTISGFDYELLQMLGQQSGLEIKLGTESCLAHCLQQLNKGRYDIIAYSTPATGDMKQMYLLSTPTSLNKHVLIQRTDTTLDQTIHNQLDLCGCTLHIAQNDPARLRIE
ncbi:MAG: transporter substrate-binding domain-containing protein, partial [Bacteroidales bacterium]|nr:transporter substrate-binding domain-containing protein [Bacteroidales bacterium]